MTNLETLSGYAEINDTDRAKVARIIRSIRRHGWRGPAVLVHDALGRAVTGSHRIAAARILSQYEKYYDIECEIVECDDEIEAFCVENDCTFEQLPLDSLRTIFEGTGLESCARKNEEW